MAEAVEILASSDLAARLSTALGEGILSVSRSDDLQKVLRVQEELLLKLDDSNKSLRSLNEHAAENLAHASARFALHTGTVTQLTGDLMRAYARIRRLKERLKAKFPDAFAQASQGSPSRKELAGPGLCGNEAGERSQGPAASGGCQSTRPGADADAEVRHGAPDPCLQDSSTVLIL
jgi:hypothetical protein